LDDTLIRTDLMKLIRTDCGVCAVKELDWSTWTDAEAERWRNFKMKQQMEQQVPVGTTVCARQSQKWAEVTQKEKS
jgi:hypothetical protein